MTEPDQRNTGRPTKIQQEQLANNPNSLHDFHVAKRGPKGIPHSVQALKNSESRPIDPGHSHAKTTHISFEYFSQRRTNARFGYEHFVSLPPAYSHDSERHWPLVLFLHGAGQSQRNPGESFLSIRHGIPKVILCYDKLQSDQTPLISIPFIPRYQQNKDSEYCDLSEDPVPPGICTLLAENFITVSPSLSMKNGYGWNAPILSALLDEISDRYRVDHDRIHVTGFSMGGYGTWCLAMYTPNRFASVIPICGGGDTKKVPSIKHIPHWIYHGEDDDTIPITASEQMVDALRKAGAEDVEFTKLEDTMHDSWTAAYNNSEVYHWMLNRRRELVAKEVAT